MLVVGGHPSELIPIQDLYGDIYLIDLLHHRNNKHRILQRETCGENSLGPSGINKYNHNLYDLTIPSLNDQLTDVLVWWHRLRLLKARAIARTQE